DSYDHNDDRHEQYRKMPYLRACHEQYDHGYRDHDYRCAQVRLKQQKHTDYAKHEKVRHQVPEKRVEGPLPPGQVERIEQDERQFCKLGRLETNAGYLDPSPGIVGFAADAGYQYEYEEDNADQEQCPYCFPPDLMVIVVGCEQHADHPDGCEYQLPFYIVVYV